MTQHYELLVLLPNTYTDDELKPVMAKIVGTMTEAGATVGFEQSLGRRRLAYPIKAHHQGYYHAWEFDAEPAKIKALTSALALNTDIVRSQIVSATVKTAEQREQELKRKLARQAQEEQRLQRRAQEEEGTSAPAAAKRAPEKKQQEEIVHVDMAEIDKKLDKILEGDTSALNE